MNTRDLTAMDASPLERLFEGTEPQTNLLDLAAGEQVPEHRHPDRTILMYVIEGAITLRVGEETASLQAGELVRFAGDQAIAPTADRASRALVVLAPRATNVSTPAE